MAEEFRADLKLVVLWLVLCGVPVPISVFALVKRGWEVAGSLVFVSLIAPVFLFIFVVRYKVIFTDREFIYRRWGPTVRIAYSDIAGIEVANVTPLTGQAVGAFVITRDGKKHPFWPKLFPKRAVERFFALGPLLQ